MIVRNLTTVALLSMLVIVEASAAGLGRLFFTPDQRQQIDEVRDLYDPTRQEIIIRRGQTVEPEVEAPPPPLPELMVNGLIRRSDGRSSAWINGTQLRTGEATADGIVLESDGGQVKFKLPSGTDTSAIKPGQMLDPNVGQVKEVYTYMSAAERARRAAEKAAADNESAPNTASQPQGAAPPPSS